MARYTGPVCRLCRQAGEKLFLKGERCYTPKCGVERRHRPPGDHLPRRRRVSEWGTQLREKQKMRNTYGVMERQFHRYFEEAGDDVGVLKPTYGQGPGAALVYRRDVDGDWQVVARLGAQRRTSTGEGLSPSIAVSGDILFVAAGDPDERWGAHYRLSLLQRS